MNSSADETQLRQRFRGFYPVVIDVETAGFNAKTDALLEIGCVTLTMDADGWLLPDEAEVYQIEPFAGANLEASALEFTGIDPFNPLRGAVSEQDALHSLFKSIRSGMKAAQCTRAILVGHNAAFDLAFVMAASERCNNRRNPFHPFSTLDTASLAAMVFGQTVLKKACLAAGLTFSDREAHQADYDTGKTAELFCCMINQWKSRGGWPPQITPDNVLP